MGLKQYSYTDLTGGIDFSRVDYGPSGQGTSLPFLPGTYAMDQQGQEYVYAKFTATLLSSDADEASIPVKFTRTFPTLTPNLDIAAARINDGKDGSDINGLCSDLVASTPTAADRVDGVVERKVIGVAAQFNPVPTATAPCGAWVKVAGIARKVLAPAIAAGDVLVRAMAGGVFVARSATQTSKESVFGVALEATDAGGCIDVQFNVK